MAARGSMEHKLKIKTRVLSSYTPIVLHSLVSLSLFGAAGRWNASRGCVLFVLVAGTTGAAMGVGRPFSPRERERNWIWTGAKCYTVILLTPTALLYKAYVTVRQRGMRTWEQWIGGHKNRNLYKYWMTAPLYAIRLWLIAMVLF